MHHGQFNVAVFLIVVGVTLLVMAISVAAGLKLRQRVFSGPARDEWEQARRQLLPKEHYSVRWATMRRRPVASARLAPAQLALTCYAQDTIRRTPLRRRWLRIGIPVCYLVAGVPQMTLGLRDHQLGILHLALGVGYVVLALAWPLVLSWSMGHGAERMRKLRADIVQRYGDVPAGNGL